MYQVTSRDDCYYTNTDTAILGKPLSEEYVSSKVLGLLKLEGFIKEGIFLAPKCYKLVTEDDQKIIKHKGSANNYVNADWFNSQYIKPSTTQNISVESNFRIDWENLNIGIWMLNSNGSHADIRVAEQEAMKAIERGLTIVLVSATNRYHLMLPPSRSMSSSLNPMEQSPIPSPIHVGGSHEHFDTSGGDMPFYDKNCQFVMLILTNISVIGHVVGKNLTKFMLHFGNLVREHIPPYYPSWLAVPLKLKDTIWEAICMEVDSTITRSDSFLVGHTHSDGTFPTAFDEEKVIAVNDISTKNPQSKYLDVDHDPLAQVFGPVKKGCENFMGLKVTKKFIKSTELLRVHITEDKESYIELENHFSQYKAKNDARFENLKDMVASHRSSGCATTSTERSRISTPLLREEAVVNFLNFHEHIDSTGRTLVLPGLQESKEAEYDVIVDIIFKEYSPVFGQRGVFFDERLISTKIKYPMILLCFAYLVNVFINSCTFFEFLLLSI
ncbi:hypothetical protein GIB67_029413 [Kingdonia uniflora]|uniref:DNA-directed DNA polymerase n=1 Tax=Kingdonia uniflora TaxID=39325 RepID=A0A7J7NXT1_9MAGN|nr:hypothetical protein GIB67_029413 [Kingdonia uniflora]